MLITSKISQNPRSQVYTTPKIIHSDSKNHCACQQGDSKVLSLHENKSIMKTINLLFVCLGNICRSPMAEGVMRHLVEQAQATAHFTIDSAGTYGGHAGQLPDRRMREAAHTRGYTLTHRSRQVVVEDFDRFDLIIAMDDNNYDNLRRLAPSPEAQNRIHRMATYLTRHADDHIPDPYYGGAAGFTHVIDLLEDACQNLLDQLRSNTI